MNKAVSTPVVRLGWLDAAKGLGIVLVIAGHVLGGLIDSPTGAHIAPFRLLFLGIYSFHMPLFFLLAGLTVDRRVARGTITFFRKLLPTIVWPYFLWSVIQLLVIFAIGSLANRPVESFWPGIVSLPWRPVSQFWFLYALFWLHVCAMLLLPRIGRDGFLLLALGAKALVLIVPMPFAIRLVLMHGFFYSVGIWLAVGGLDALLGRYRPYLRTVLLAASALLIVAVTVQAAPLYAPDVNIMTAGSPKLSNVAWRFPAMAAALSGLLAVVSIAMMPAMANSTMMQWIGRRSMPIFLLHILFVAGARILLVRLGLGSEPWLLACILIVAGLAGPLFCAAIATRLRMDRLLGLT